MDERASVEQPSRIVMYAATLEIVIGGLCTSLLLVPVFRAIFIGPELSGGTMLERWTLLGNVLAGVLGALHIANGIGVWQRKRWAFAGLMVLLPVGAALQVLACGVTIWADMTGQASVWAWGVVPDAASAAAWRVAAYFAIALGTLLVVALHAGALMVVRRPSFRREFEADAVKP